MLYTEWIVDNKTYKLRLTTMGVLALEDKLGKNPADIFLALSDGQLPKVRDVVSIIHQSLQANHNGFTLDKTAALLDTYFESGHSVYDLVSNEIMKVFQDAGLLGTSTDDGEEEGEEAKN